MRETGKFVVLQLLRAYKWAISPMFAPACRYVPTCSDYATEAVERYGVLRGGWMAAVRLVRCHPFVRGGYDPVVKRNLGLVSDSFERGQFPQGLKPIDISRALRGPFGKLRAGSEGPLLHGGANDRGETIHHGEAIDLRAR